MKRRRFITLLGGAAAAWPLAARAQRPPAMPVIGFLGPESPDLFGDRLPAFLQALSEAGFVEGRSVAIDYRWAEGHNERLSTLAVDLVRRGVNVIVAPGSTPAVFAAKSATTTVPIVFFVGSDPVRIGLVASLNRPGGNVTGVTTLNVEVVPKRLQFLHELVPRATAVAVLLNPTNPAAETEARDLQAAAGTLGLRLQVVHASSERDFDRVFDVLAKQQIELLVIGTDALFNTRSAQLASLTVRHAMPTIHAWRAFPKAGGLISFGSSILGGYRQVGVYTSRILKGEKPADLPVEQVTKVELVLNLKTAKALGVEVPTAILLRADEVIE